MRQARSTNGACTDGATLWYIRIAACPRAGRHCSRPLQYTPPWISRTRRRRAEIGSRVSTLDSGKADISIGVVELQPRERAAQLRARMRAVERASPLEAERARRPAELAQRRPAQLGDVDQIR